MISYKHLVKIYYKDIDQMGIVYYSRYFEYFEEARTELLHSINLDVSTIEENGIYLPVITSHCDYKRGVEFEQEIIILTSIPKLPRAKLLINYTGYLKDSQEILFEGYTIHAFMRKSGKPTKVPKEILSTLNRYF